MQAKYINTGGIQFIRQMEGSGCWYWGTDVTDGDMYEAQELYEMGHEKNSSRLVLVKYPEGTVYEPVARRDGLYFGVPVFSDGKVNILAVDFPQKKIMLLQAGEDMKDVSEEASLSLCAVPDCYNLRLITSPLSIIRQGSENLFQIIWPRKAEFYIDPAESIDHREGSELIFSKWYEDPDYREETVIRSYPSGEITKRIRGSVYAMKDGTSWIVD